MKKIEKRIRTKAWLNFIKTAGGLDNPNQIGKYIDEQLEQREDYSFVGDSARNFTNYANGRGSPTEATRDVIDDIFMGSAKVFTSGPEGSGLFEAMFNAKYQPEGWGYFGWFESLHLCYSDDPESGYKATMRCLRTRMNEGNLFMPEESISPATEVNLLASTLYILQKLTSSERTRFSEIEEVLTFIFDFYGNSKFQKELIELDLHDSILEWMIIRIENYCLSRAYQSLTLNRELPGNASNLKDDLSEIIEFVKSEVLYETASIDSAHNLRIHLGYIQPPVNRSCTT